MIRRHVGNARNTSQPLNRAGVRGSCHGSDRLKNLIHIETSCPEVIGYLMNRALARNRDHQILSLRIRHFSLKLQFHPQRNRSRELWSLDEARTDIACRERQMLRRSYQFSS